MNSINLKSLTFLGFALWAGTTPITGTLFVFRAVALLFSKLGKRVINDCKEEIHTLDLDILIHRMSTPLYRHSRYGVCRDTVWLPKEESPDLPSLLVYCSSRKERRALELAPDKPNHYTFLFKRLSEKHWLWQKWFKPFGPYSCSVI